MPVVHHVGLGLVSEPGDVIIPLRVPGVNLVWDFLWITSHVIWDHVQEVGALRYKSTFIRTILSNPTLDKEQVPVAQPFDSAIHRINHYPVVSVRQSYCVTQCLKICPVDNAIHLSN